jgi:O-antigen/teichoic acid export membrane protein
VVEEAVPDRGVPHREFWPPLVRFAAWVWVINLFCHLFGVVDRYMLVHWSGLDDAAALALVGNYHASRVIPILFLSIADLLAGVVMPYLSHDWEIGKREAVSDRLNLVLKLTAVVLLAGGVVVLWVSPLLFRVAFEGHYEAGLAVMPWTLTYCIWYSLLLVAQNYVWCAEKTRLAVLPLGAGLIVNIALNVALIPAWGLHGAVASTTIATGVAILVLYWVNQRAGMQLQRGMFFLTAAPAALCGGAWCGTLALLLIATFLPFSRMLVTQKERDAIAALAQAYLSKLSNWRLTRRERGEASHAV